MTPQTQENYVHKVLSRGSLAELREIVETCDDRETALPIYREIKRLSRRMEDKHKFGKEVKVFVVKS